MGFGAQATHQVEDWVHLVESLLTSEHRDAIY
jgi:hypothetical protein